MRPLPRLDGGIPIPLGDIPTAIWMPSKSQQLPDCYQGTPLEMVEQMAAEMGPKLTAHDAIDFLIEFLNDQRDIRIQLPAEDESLPDTMPEFIRATYFIAILLDAGVARPMDIS